MHNSLKITGTFRCKVFENGKLIQDFTGPNLVVDNGKRKLAEILAIGGAAGSTIRIGFGEGTTPPSPDDLELTGARFSKNISGVSFDPHSGDPAVVYSWELGNMDANGITITEFGLLIEGEQLFARKTGITIAKIPTITLTGEWTITIN